MRTMNNSLGQPTYTVRIRSNTLNQPTFPARTQYNSLTQFSSPTRIRSNTLERSTRPTRRSNDVPLEDVFTTQDGQTFVFWDTERYRLLIKHGSYITVVYYDETDAKSCRTSFTRLRTNGKQEQYIYCNGRPVASYLPELGCVVIKRDGEIYSFDNPEPPIGFTTRSSLDIYVEMAADMKMKADWYD
ncbi:hypothetical protein IKG31_01980 [Candidatus Saccharibacteria bacterium]|nr:hypothetical protein [Candidatus Saccharibacteria bacterium]